MCLLVFNINIKVELYTVDSSVKEIVEKLVASDMRFHFSCFTSASFMVHTSHLRLAAVHLVDSHYCSDPAKFISVCLTSLTTMLQVYQLMLSVHLMICVLCPDCFAPCQPSEQS